MQSDKHFYQIFEVNPQWLFELTGRTSPGPCKFVSTTLKAIERRTDGLLLPELVDQPITIAELQMQADGEVYLRTVIEMAMVQSEHIGRRIEGLVIFGARSLDPHTEPWRRVVSSYYLDELLERLEMQSPGHPLVAVFQPLMQADLTILEHEAGRYYNEIAQGVIDDRQRLRLQEVFMDWLLQRFSDRGAKEIEKMLVGQLPDLRDTQTGKELIAIGKIEGREEGREEGKEYGLRHGELIGQIRILQEVLGMETTDRRVLAESSLELLSSQLAELRAMFNQH